MFCEHCGIDFDQRYLTASSREYSIKAARDIANARQLNDRVGEPIVEKSQLASFIGWLGLQCRHIDVTVSQCGEHRLYFGEGGER